METVILIDILDANGTVKSRHRFERSGTTASCTIGRGAAADVTIDDPHVAPVHARFTTDETGAVTVTDLGSVNGVEIEGHRIRGAQEVLLIDRDLRIGRTRLRVRTAGESIPAEVPDKSKLSVDSGINFKKLLIVGFVAAILVLGFSTWTKTIQARELPTVLITMAVGIVILAAAWVSIWALISRIAIGEPRWIRHAAIMFCFVAAAEGFGLISYALSGALGLYLSPIVESVIVGALVIAWLSTHLANASTMRLRHAVGLGAVLPVIALCLTLWTTEQGQARSATYIPDRNKIVPPTIMLRSGMPLTEFANDLAALGTDAERKRAFVEKEDPSPNEDADD